MAGEILAQGALHVLLRGVEVALAQRLHRQPHGEQCGVEIALVVGGDDHRTLLGYVFRALEAQAVVGLEEERRGFHQQGHRQIAVRQFQGRGVGVEQLVPVLHLHLHACLTLCHVACQRFDVAEARHVGHADVGAEGLLDEALQRHHIQRVEGQVGLDVVGGLQREVLLLFDVVFDDAVFLEVGLLHCGFRGLLLGCRRAAGEDVFEFEALQLLQSGAGQFAAIHHQAHQLLVVRHREVVGLQHFALERLLHLFVAQSGGPGFLGHDDGAQHVAVLHDGGFLHAFGVFLQLVFDFVGLHVLAVGEHDDLLAASGEVEASAVVQMAQVAGVQIAVFVDDLGGFFGSVVVALHHVGAFGAHLSVHNLAVHRGDGLAHAVGHQVARTGEGDHGGRLRHAVAFEQFQAQRLQPHGDLTLQGSAAAHHVFHVSAHLLVDGFEDEARELDAVHPGAEGEEQTAHGAGVDLLLDAGVERLPQTGHADHDGDLAPLHGVHDVGSRHRGADGHAAAYVKRHHHGAHQRQHMVQGQQDERAALGVEDGHLFGDGAYIHQYVAEREHHALGRPRGAGGVDDEGGVFLVVCDFGLFIARGCRLQLVDDVDVQRLSGLFDGGLHRLQFLAGDPCADGLAVVDDVAHVADGGRGVHGDGDAAVGPHRVEGVDPSLAVFREDERPLAGGVLALFAEERDALQQLSEADFPLPADDGNAFVVFNHGVQYLIFLP